ncbi:hypothetical protein BUL40_12280 [Croceivirga radicis]|uniref:DgsA anti-repressor MtfA n=1 Tax=Croceivirga radicis TaxID=1929488 RepID=A0A1V6LPW6_9FLAO|nr:zinc-dependent peptidase [Croceivirga radicis]OQD42188.1 hypothetical protein BUL40_12280 [Croceivirga radicis]
MWVVLNSTEKYIALIFLTFSILVVVLKGVYQILAKERFAWRKLFNKVKPITEKERHFITAFLLPYQQFTHAERKQFLKRFAWFRSRKSFVFYGAIEEPEQIKAYVTASAILLTMGLRNYKYENSIRRIIIYPSAYYSKIAKRYHLGEYNPRFKTLVFAADELAHGFRIPNDNKNLGLHEAAHALMFEFDKMRGWEARKFRLGIRKFKGLFENPNFKKVLEGSTYFRPYSKTSFIEFFAVAVENFVESPSEFKTHYPGLFYLMTRIFNLGTSTK